MATLVDNVYVGGRFYGPDHGGDAEVTPEVAALITDPKAWGGDQPTSPASSSSGIEGVPLHQQTVVVDPSATMTAEEVAEAQASIEAEMRAEAATAALDGDFGIPGFEWLADPGAHAALELAEEAADPVGLEDGGWARVDGVWFLRPPGRRAARLSDQHTVIEHDDLTITVSPSIVYGKPGDADYWHGFLEAGVWREC